MEPTIDSFAPVLSWIRRRKTLVWGLIFLTVIYLANHAEYRYRLRKCSTTNSNRAAVVHIERNTLGGHKTIGIDEELSRAENGTLFLRFSMLGQWDFDPARSNPCPAEIAKLSGRPVSCLGFMYPLEPGTSIKTFCLLRTTQTCCYGPRPQYNQYLLVETDHPVKFERLTPVIVTGRFYPDSQPAQGFIYRMEATSVTPLADEGPEADAAEMARKANVPLFDFSLLESLKDSPSSSALPEALLKLDGNKAVLRGTVCDRTEAPTRILVGKSLMGVPAQGNAPSLYNAIMVYPMDADQIPPVWKETGIFIGIIHIERNPVTWRQNGIVSLRKAMRNGGLPQGGGPILSVSCELLLALIVLLFAMGEITMRIVKRQYGNTV